MKKMLIVMLLATTASMANAAAFKWAAANIYGPDGTTKWSGTVTLYCAEVSSFSSVQTAANGVVKAANSEFSSTSFVADQTYSFYFTIESGGQTFTSQTVTSIAQASDVPTIQFGNMASRTQDASNWGGGSGGAPEPTSGLLLLVGAGILSLRRKRV